MSSPHNPRRVQLLICLDGLSRTEWSSGSEGPDTDLGAFDTPSGSWGCREGGLPGGSFLPKLRAQDYQPAGPHVSLQSQCFHVPMSRAKQGHQNDRHVGGAPAPSSARPSRPFIRAFTHSVVHALPRCSAL